MIKRHWGDIPELRERAKLAALVNEYWSVSDIAAKLGCSSTSVRTALKFHRLPTVPLKRRMTPLEEKHE